MTEHVNPSLAHPIPFPSASPRPWRWTLGVALALLAVCGCAVAVSLGLLATHYLDVAQGWYDADYEQLSAALSARWDPDDTIPSASLGFDWYSGTYQAPKVWLVIEISYTGACEASKQDPCEALVDELAGIVFANYGRIDELTGLRIAITNSWSLGIVEYSNTPIDKALTIEAWRTELDKR